VSRGPGGRVEKR